MPTGNRCRKASFVVSEVRGAKSGGIVTQEASIHISNVQVVDGDNKPTRVGKRVDSEGRNVRVARRTGKDL